MRILLLILFHGGISFLIAHFLGRKRQIGFKYSFIFCFTLSPIFGFIVTMLSRKYYSDNPRPSIIKKIFGWFFIFIGGMTISGAFLLSKPVDIYEYVELIPQFGLVWLGYYLIQLGKGERFDDDLVIIEKNKRNSYEL